MKTLHGFENHTVGLERLTMLQARSETGEVFSRPVLQSALEIIGRSDVESIYSLLAARLEVMQVFFGGPDKLAKKLDEDTSTIKKLRHGHYSKLTRPFLKKIDELWDRTYKLMRHGQI